MEMLSETTVFPEQYHDKTFMEVVQRDLEHRIFDLFMDSLKDVPNSQRYQYTVTAPMFSYERVGFVYRVVAKSEMEMWVRTNGKS